MKSTRTNCRLSDPAPLVIKALNERMSIARLYGRGWLIYSKDKKFMLKIKDSQMIEMIKSDVLVEDNNQYCKITLGPKYIQR